MASERQHFFLRRRPRSAPARSTGIFPYPELPPVEYVRFLELQPGTGPVTCKLRVEALGSFVGAYDALSYCWGSPEKARNVVVDGMSVPVTVNLHDALERLRRDAGTEPRLIWADAICINQKDKAEQSSQVRMMGRIYEHARSVPIWLGRDDQNVAKECFDFLKSTARDIRDLVAKYGSPEKIPATLPETLKWKDQARWQDVRTMMDSVWFSRVWVQQEVSLAAESVFMLGSESLPVQDLLEIPLVAQDYGELFAFVPPPLLYLIRNTFIEIWRSYGNSRSWRNELSPHIVKSVLEKESDTSFLKILHQARHFSATDPRDHVYAFLAHPATRHPETKVPLVEPNYEKDVQDVLFETARAVLETWPADLTFLLSCVDRDQETLESVSPSWVPQWHRTTGLNCFGYPGETADGDFTNVAFEILEDRSLKLSGHVLDEIAWVHGPTSTAEFDTVGGGAPPKPALPLVAGLWRQATRREPPPARIWRKLVARGGDPGAQYDDADGRRDAFFLTMVAGRKIRGAAAAARHRADFAAYCVAIGARLPGMSPDEQAALARGGDPLRVEKDVKWANQGRRFFATRSGYFGLGHDLVRPGDVCATFKGVGAPHVLRPTGDAARFKLVGDAYIHGISNGPVLEEMGLSGLRDIILV